MPVEISICIPAYKNTAHLQRLLDSIAMQTYRDFEIVITDDSPDDSVKLLAETYSISQPLHYFKNQSRLGTPENWNESVRRARGNWIKLMHNDDWFTSPASLQRFYDTTLAYPQYAFFFSAFQNIIENTGNKQVVTCNGFDLFFLRLSAFHLFKRVYVGNPSCTLIRRDIDLFYDNRFKFVVDFEFYIRCFRKLGGYRYIDEILLNIGFHDEQVTKYTFRVPEVQIPENLIMLEKFGTGILKNPVVYDYYWRMFRNLSIRSEDQARQYYSGNIPPPLKQMIRFQSGLSPRLLKVGIFSKLLMSFHYFLSLFKSH